MWHVEGFDARGDPAQMEAFLVERFLPYFREQGFSVRVFASRAKRGPRQFWLATEMDHFGSIDASPARAGDEGARLLAELLAGVDRLQAGVVEELGAAEAKS
jgi:hypothetical protein